MSTGSIIGLVLFCLFIAAIGAMWVVGRRKEVAERTAYATDRGWTFQSYDAALTWFSDGPPFGRGEKRKCHDAFRGVIKDHDFVAFEYEYEITDPEEWERGGRRHHMVVAIPAPSDGNALQVQEETLVGRALEYIGVTDIQFHDPEFDKRFRITTNNPEFATAALTEPTRRGMLGDPWLGVWSMRIEPGQMLLLRKGEINLDDIEPAVARLIDTRCAIPESAWRSQPPALGIGSIRTVFGSDSPLGESVFGAVSGVKNRGRSVIGRRFGV